MSRQRERLDRLMGLLGSETVGGRDVRQGVMMRLAGSGAVRSTAAMACRLSLLLAAVLAIVVAVELWFHGRRAADLGTSLRRGVEWMVPSKATGVRPAPPTSRRPSLTAWARGPGRST